VIALGLAVVTQAAVLFVPWDSLFRRAGVVPVVREHATVVECGDWYWIVVVTDSALTATTVVRGRPTDDPGFAHRQARAYGGRHLLAAPEMPERVRVESDHVPGWVAFATHDPLLYRTTYGYPERCNYLVTGTAIGWPWRALREERTIADWMVSPGEPGGANLPLARTTTVRGQIELPVLGTLPYLPIWRGIVLDLLVLTLPWCLLLWAAGAARRRRRSRRGRCAECSYDLTGLGVGSVCPECGLQPNRIAPPKRG
jgi:hypothetical protein